MSHLQWLYEYCSFHIGCLWKFLPVYLQNTMQTREQLKFCSQTWLGMTWILESTMPTKKGNLTHAWTNFLRHSTQKPQYVKTSLVIHVQAHTLKLEWGVLVPSRWTIMEQEIYILLSWLTINSIHNTNFIKQSWNSVQNGFEFKSTRTKLSKATHYTISRSTNISEWIWRIARQGCSKLFQDGMAQVYIRI